MYARMRLAVGINELWYLLTQYLLSTHSDTNRIAATKPTTTITTNTISFSFSLLNYVVGHYFLWHNIHPIYFWTRSSPATFTVIHSVAGAPTLRSANNNGCD